MSRVNKQFHYYHNNITWYLRQKTGSWNAKKGSEKPQHFEDIELIQSFFKCKFIAHTCQFSTLNPQWACSDAERLVFWTKLGVEVDASTWETALVAENMPVFWFSADVSMAVILTHFPCALEPCCSAGVAVRAAPADERAAVIVLECALGRLSRWHCQSAHTASLFFRPLLAPNQGSAGWGHLLPCPAYAHKWPVKTLNRNLA